LRTVLAEKDHGRVAHVLKLASITTLIQVLNGIHPHYAKRILAWARVNIIMRNAMPTLGGNMLRVRSISCCALAAASAVGLAGAALTACSSGQAAEGVPEQRVIVVDSVPAAEEAGLYVAQDEGYFQQQGLTVQIRPVTGGEAGIPDLQDGKAQIVGGNYVSFVQAQIAGRFRGKPASFKIVAAGSQLQPGNDALYAMPQSAFATVSDLVKHHAKVGLNNPDNVGNVLYGSLLAQYGASLSDVRQVIPAGGFPALLTMLGKGQVDAAWFPEPFGTMAEQEFGAIQIADFDQGSVQNYPFTGYIGATSWVRSHPRTVAAFTRAIIAGQQAADGSRGAVERAMEKYTGLPPLIAATMSIDTYPLALNLPALQRVPNSMLEFGVIDKPYKIDEMLAVSAPGPAGNHA
jgi:NitT/TauT family transport system substrate-binding protein